MTRILIKLELLEVLGELNQNQIDRYNADNNDFVTIIDILEEVGKISHEQAETYRKEVS